MPFIPHTQDEIREMLKVIGVNSIEDLFDEIPKKLMIDENKLNGVPEAMSEMEVTHLMKNLASKNKNGLCFAGAGAYEHHIPAPIWEILSRGEFMTAYTPYQAEASQGTLQLIYEYQTMITSLTGMDVSNASMYEGGSALAEAVLMSVRANKKSKSKRVLIPNTVHPFYRQAVKSIATHQGIEIVELPFDKKTGCIDPKKLSQYDKEDIASIVISQPNFFGCLEDVDAITNWASAHNALSIAVVNPIALGLLKEPGKWGEKGVDIVCGEGQPFGIPISSGGPYFGFICCKKEHVRQMPGRIIGRTLDHDGKPGFVLTLQAREQHIRRSKATSNICSNEGLIAAAATIYMSLLGPKGILQVAEVCHDRTRELVKQATMIKGVTKVFDKPYFHEVVLHLPKPAKEVIEKMDKKNILAGFDLGRAYPDMENDLLVCCTETKSIADVGEYVKALKEVLA